MGTYLDSKLVSKIPMVSGSFIMFGGWVVVWRDFSVSLMYVCMYVCISAIKLQFDTEQAPFCGLH